MLLWMRRGFRMTFWLIAHRGWLRSVKNFESQVHVGYEHGELHLDRTVWRGTRSARRARSQRCGVCIGNHRGRVAIWVGEERQRDKAAPCAGVVSGKDASACLG